MKIITKEGVRNVRRGLTLLFAILIFMYLGLGFLSGGIGGIDSISNISNENQKRILDNYGVVLPADATVVKFQRTFYMTNAYFVLKIKGVKDIDAFVKTNENIEYVSKFGKGIDVYPNVRYIKGNGKCQCYYSKKYIYLTVDGLVGIEYNKNISNLFNELYQE